MTLLNKELNKLNVFFIEKEEEYVIRLQRLKYRIERLKKEQAANDGRVRGNCGYEDLLKILRDIVASHGEMVLLENYSSLNYTDLVKIMKKHDKVTGTLLRLRYIQSVLLQPFFTTELLSKLVRVSIVVALKTMKEIRKRSTPSIFSLPPMNRTDSEEMFGISVDQSLVHPVTVDL
nr:SPX domain-containing protein 1-like [Physcomitrium patens]|eukprot:XP_024362273.1 SPX domain-containing protein 1-like [Physcomitrella patens]